MSNVIDATARAVDDLRARDLAALWSHGPARSETDARFWAFTRDLEPVERLAWQTASYSNPDCYRLSLLNIAATWDGETQISRVLLFSPPEYAVPANPLALWLFVQECCKWVNLPDQTTPRWASTCEHGGVA